MPVLSSDALEDQFGPVQLEILYQNKINRIIATKVAGSGQILELSRVSFRSEGTAAFPDIHRKIIAGASMGKAFADSAVPFNRQVRASYRYDQHSLPVIFTQWFGTPKPPAVTSVSIVVGPDDVPYADILEVYSPEVLPWELTEDGMNQAVIDQVNTFGAALAALTAADTP
jgi:hypothetical protein